MPSNRPDHKPLRLPPGFRGHEVDDAWSRAMAAASGDGAPGTVFHAPLGAMLEAALLLAPDRPVSEASLLRMALLALTGAIVGVVPPESVVEPRMPAVVALNGGEVARARVACGETAATGEPAWAVLGLSVRVALRLESPGDVPWQTDLAEEGADVPAAELLESLCRHLLAGFDLWTDEGAAGLDRAWHRIAATMLPA